MTMHAITQGESYHPRQIALSYVSEYRVSTVLLSNGDCFETIVFDGLGREEACIQTMCRDHAEIGHHSICKLLAKDQMPSNRYVVSD